MSKSRGLWVSPTQFVEFADPGKSLSEQIATRNRSIDFSSLGMYLPNPDPVLKSLGRDIQVYRELRGDAHVAGCIRRRKAAVKTLETGIDRGIARSRVARAVESMFADLDVARIIGEMLDAPLYGYQPLEVMWGRVGSYIVPVDVVGKPPDWFIYSTDNELRFRSRQHMLTGEELPPRKFLVARQDATYQNPYGFPDLSAVFWPTTFKKGGLKFWVTFVEKYGMPWVIGKHPRSASDTEKNLLLDSMDDMVQDAVAVIPDDSSIDIREAAGKSNSADVYERLLHFCRGEVAIALLGQNQTTEATSTRASAQAGLEVTADIRDGDASIVRETMDTLIRWVCELNFGDGEARPKFGMWAQETVDKVMAERDERLTRAGARFTPQYFARAYQLQPGDLATSTQPTDAPAQFAESGSVAPDQDAIDAALDALSPADMHADVAALLAPVMQRVRDGAPPDELLGALADIYPDMDASGLQERLARLIFVANCWGRLHA